MIPSTINGKKVTKIDDNAFRDNKNIESVSLLEDVTEIGDNAFKGCENLEQVIIGENVTSISPTAFEGCDNVMIYGVKGTYAEQYAAENNIDFVNMDNLVCDVTEDDIIDSADSLMILRFSIDIVIFSRVTIVYADSNGDKTPNSFDALQALRFSVGLPFEGRVGRPVIER